MAESPQDQVAGVLPGMGTGSASSGGSGRAGAGSMRDVFADDREPGKTVGSSLADGTVRRGVDRERVIGIDNGALRMQPLVEPGWGRCGIAYGPYARRNGLAFGAMLLNGHNTSQAEPLPDSFRMRIERWLLGAETDPRAVRLRRMLAGRQRRYIWRRLLQWFRTGTRLRHVPAIDQNMSVGWFPAVAPADPQQQGNGFVMHALGPECGELRAKVGMRCPAVLKGVQNVPIYYLVVLRDEGAAYYVASMPGVPGMSAVPSLRPVAIDAFGSDPEVFAGVHQSVLGQIGWRVDTRLFSAQVDALDGYRHWFGSAHAADRLAGGGDLHGSAAEVGGAWRVVEGALARTAGGVASAAPAAATALLSPPRPSGLIHMVVDVAGRAAGTASLLWRVADENNHWRFEADGGECRLVLVADGVRHPFPALGDRALTPNGPNTLQVLDDGAHVQFILNAENVFSGALRDSRLADATGAGFALSGAAAGMAVRAFEAHPRTVPLPATLHAVEPWNESGERTVARDDFRVAADDLDGLATPVGGRVWTRAIGQGCFAPDGHGALRVRASLQSPCPGRTAYMLDWDNPDFVDVSVTITPPGTQRGQRQKGRGGLILWQDAGCYVTFTVFMDDWYGTSIAAFFQVDGYDELYDAVWSNVGRRIHWGVPYRFRVVSDGRRFVAFVDGEPVLYRAFSDIYRDWERLRLARVGVVTNWEWGNDTGTVFEDFEARDRG